MSTVLVTGANGFIGSHVVKQLLEKHYTVVGTIRSETKAKQTTEWFGSGYHSVVIDVEKGDTFEKAFNSFPDISIIFHVAAPFDLTVSDFTKELLEGGDKLTDNLLQTSDKHEVRRFVNVSSVAANATGEEYVNPSSIINEDTWNSYTLEEGSQSVFHAYQFNKTRAERKFWKFIESHPKIIGNSVNPTYVGGPQILDTLAGRGQLNTSSEIFRNFLFAGPDGKDKIMFFEGGMVDVRDVSKTIIAAGESDTIKNKRLLLSPSLFTVQQLVNIARRQFPSIQPHVIPDAETKYQMAKFDDSKTRGLLGFEFIPLETTIYDTVSQIIGQHPEKFK